MIRSQQHLAPMDANGPAPQPLTNEENTPAGDSPQSQADVAPEQASGAALQPKVHEARFSERNAPRVRTDLAPNGADIDAGGQPPTALSLRINRRSLHVVVERQHLCPRLQTDQSPIEVVVLPLVSSTAAARYKLLVRVAEILAKGDYVAAQLPVVIGRLRRRSDRRHQHLKQVQFVMQPYPAPLPGRQRSFAAAHSVQPIST